VKATRSFSMNGKSDGGRSCVSHKGAAPRYRLLRFSFSFSFFVCVAGSPPVGV
jgi:hypothetical protein